MRIIAGAYKGRRLATPRGATTRPTADQVRIALLDTLMPWLPGARVLDLFAGAGGGDGCARRVPDAPVRRDDADVLSSARRRRRGRRCGEPAGAPLSELRAAGTRRGEARALVDALAACAPRFGAEARPEKLRL